MTPPLMGAAESGDVPIRPMPNAISAAMKVPRMLTLLG
jgi:hypothetical protein